MPQEALYTQILSIDSAPHVGAEVLVRDILESPDFFFRAPDYFVNDAEIHGLDRGNRAWILRRASLAYLSERFLEVLEPLKVHCIPTKEDSDPFIDLSITIEAVTRLAWGHLCIREEIAIHAGDYAIRVLNEVSKTGESEDIAAKLFEDIQTGIVIFLRFIKLVPKVYKNATGENIPREKFLDILRHHDFKRIALSIGKQGAYVEKILLEHIREPDQKEMPSEYRQDAFELIEKNEGLVLTIRQEVMARIHQAAAEAGPIPVKVPCSAFPGGLLKFTEWLIDLACEHYVPQVSQAA